MTLTPAQIATWYRSVDRLNDVTTAWNTLGINIDNLFTSYVANVTTVHSRHWEGKAADAAQDRARRDRATADALVDKLTDLGKQVTAGYHAINAPLRRAYAALQALDANDFHVGSHIRDITDPTPTPRGPSYLPVSSMTWRPARRRRRKPTGELRHTINSAAEASRPVRLRPNPQLPAGPRGRRQTNHGPRLTEPGTAATHYRRRDAHTAATTEWRAGHDVVLPAGQMAYLNALSRSLDDVSPQQLDRILDRLPPNVRSALAQSLQIISSPQVTTSLTDANPAVAPARGGRRLLPSRLAQALTRPDLVKDDIRITTVSTPSPSKESTTTRPSRKLLPQRMTGTNKAAI